MALGYTDTPLIPGQQWKVHDDARPQPRVVTPGTASTDGQPGQPPSDAVILFNGSDLSGWEKGDGSAAAWKVENGYMEVVPGTGNIRTKAKFGDQQLHLEFASPSVVKGDSQGRGNSGVFLFGLYEVQVLDCYENPTYSDGTTGAIYGQFPPLVNACRKPGDWSTYDIFFRAPRFNGDDLAEPAVITVVLNGIVLHHALPILGPTQHREAAHYWKHDATGPLELQDHGDLVRFRNIWVREIKAYDAP